MEDVLVTAK
jgi:hypothetical protein